MDAAAPLPHCAITVALPSSWKIIFSYTIFAVFSLLLFSISLFIRGGRRCRECPDLIEASQIDRYTKSTSHRFCVKLGGAAVSHRIVLTERTS